MPDFDTGSPRQSYEEALKDALSMSADDILKNLADLELLSDHPTERIFTAGMQLQAAAYQEALEIKRSRSK